MSAPVIWIFLPAIIGIGFVLFYRRINRVEFWGSLVAFSLALAAVLVPVGASITVRGFIIRISPSFTVLGRQFLIREEMTSLILAVYGAAFLWFAMAAVVKPGRYFVPLGLITIAVFIASTSFRPWEFVGIFVLIAVYLLVMILSPSDHPPTQGVLNFLSFNVLGVPFLLIAGGLISGLASTPPGLPIVARPAIFLGVGFVLLLALFPFHAWMPRLVEETNPFSAAFVLVFLPGFVSILLLQVIDRNVWLRNSEEVFAMLRAIGLVTVIAGGLFAASQQNLGRILGFSALVETGTFLLAFGVGPREAAGLFFPLLLARSLAFLTWSTGLAEIRKSYKNLDFRVIQGAARRHHFAAVAVLVGSLSSAGLPLLAGYIPRIRLYAALAPIAPTEAVALWFGSLGLLVAGLRTIAVFSMLPEGEDAVSSPVLSEFSLRFRSILLGSSILLLLLAGIIPNWIKPMINLLPLAFDHLRP